MGILSERARRRVHVGQAARNYTLTIGDHPYTDKVKSLSGVFDPKGGGSALTMQVKGSLEGLEDAPVVLRVGYGDQDTEFFSGTLQEPGQLSGGKAVAYGPFKLMADQSFTEAEAYINVPISYIFKDLEARAGYFNGQIEIIGGSQNVEFKAFTEETSLLEGARAVAPDADFVFYDRPGPGAPRRLMPIPKSGGVFQHTALYTQENYQENALDITETRQSHYSKVVIFRRDQAGNYAVRAEAPISARSRFKPPANRIYYITDFTGNQVAAQQMAYDVSQRLSDGEFKFTLNSIWLNPELEPWSAFLIEREEIRPESASITGEPGRFMVTYRCLISESYTFDIGRDSHHMSVAGTAVKLFEVKIPEPIRIRSTQISPGFIFPGAILGLKPNPGLKPNVGLKPRKTRYGFEGGPIIARQIGGLKPNVGMKPNTGLKPRRSRLGFVESLDANLLGAVTSAGDPGALVFGYNGDEVFESSTLDSFEGTHSIRFDNTAQIADAHDWHGIYAVSGEGQASGTLVVCSAMVKAPIGVEYGIWKRTHRLDNTFLNDSGPFAMQTGNGQWQPISIAAFTESESFRPGLEIGVYDSEGAAVLYIDKMRVEAQ